MLGNNDGPDVADWGAPQTLELDLDGLAVAMIHDSGPQTGQAADATTVPGRGAGDLRPLPHPDGVTADGGLRIFNRARRRTAGSAEGTPAGLEITDGTLVTTEIIELRSKAGPVSDDFELRRSRYDHPDAVALTEQAQSFYVENLRRPGRHPVHRRRVRTACYGGFLIGYLDDRPVAMGGWRFSPVLAPEGAKRPSEIKRMFVDEAVRGRGLARRLLQALEDDAQAAGADWMILETGRPQVAAIGLYRAGGYGDMVLFGFYADKPEVVSLGRRLRRKR